MVVLDSPHRIPGSTPRNPTSEMESSSRIFRGTIIRPLNRMDEVLVSVQPSPQSPQPSAAAPLPRAMRSSTSPWWRPPGSAVSPVARRAWTTPSTVTRASAFWRGAVPPVGKAPLTISISRAPPTHSRMKPRPMLRPGSAPRPYSGALSPESGSKPIPLALRWSLALELCSLALRWSPVPLMELSPVPSFWDHSF